MKNNGTVETSKTIKAGCGIRYDPDELGEHTGFDFAAASALLEGNADDDDSNALDGTIPNQGDGGN